MPDLVIILRSYYRSTPDLIFNNILTVASMTQHKTNQGLSFYAFDHPFFN